jgi:parallel beta-helix repeat protein
MKIRRLGGSALLCALVQGCSEAPAPPPADASFQNTLIERLLDAKPGDVVEIPAGRFAIDRSLTLRTDGVTLRGAGHDKSILSFAGQISGAEGLLVTADDFTIEHLAIEDTKGDGLKVNEGRNITIRGIRVEWTGGPKTENGAYGIYPVQTRNVLIEDSIAIGASDAGIYVGQSKDVVVRRNRAEYNVAGIEIENTIGADVYDNVAINNTGGILVFNMPNLPQPGHTCRVFRNRIEQNNTGNFAAKGAAVASVPAGSGIVINSNDRVEIFDNDIRDNATANIIVSSYFSTGYMNDYGIAEAFDPYPEDIHIHGNRLSGGGDSPDGMDLKALRIALYGLGGRLPDVLWDGYVRKAEDGSASDPRICIADVSGLLNADGPNGYADPAEQTERHRCSIDRLPAVQWAGLDAAVDGAAPASQAGR